MRTAMRARGFVIHKSQTYVTSIAPPTAPTVISSDRKSTPPLTCVESAAMAFRRSLITKSGVTSRRSSAGSPDLRERLSGRVSIDRTDVDLRPTWPIAGHRVQKCDGRNHRDLPARRPDGGSSGLPGLHARRRQERDGACLQGSRHSALPPTRPRHRYASVKLRDGVPVTDLAAQPGHSRKSLTLDTYSHVLVH